MIANSGVLQVKQFEPLPYKPDQHVVALQVQFKASNVTRQELISTSKTDPFLAWVARPYMAPQAVRVHRNEVILNTRHPEWMPETLPIEVYGGLDAPLQVEVWDQDPKGKAKYIGRTRLTLRELTFFDRHPTFPIKHPAKDGSIGYSNSALLTVVACTPLFPRSLPHTLAAPQVAPLTFEGDAKAVRPLSLTSHHLTSP